MMDFTWKIKDPRIYVWQVATDLACPWPSGKLVAVLVLAICLALMVAPFVEVAGGEVGGAVITWGADLSPRDRAKVRRLMQISPSDDVWEMQVTNSEEHALLGSSVPATYLGTRAISSAYVRPLQAGSGLEITTHNITWVTKRMFAQALLTGGMQDAEVIVAAPIRVSGTAALTGIFKAFEAAADTELSEEAKRIAGEELYVTREIGEEIGHELSSDLVTRIKQEVIKENPSDKAAIIELIHRVSREAGVELSSEDVEKIAELMTKIKGLNLRFDDLQAQLDNVAEEVDRLLGTQMSLKDTVTSWFERLVNLIARFLDQFLSFAGGGLNR